MQYTSIHISDCQQCKSLKPSPWWWWWEVILITQSVFFVNSRKTAAHSTAVFYISFHTSISHSSRNFQSKFISGQITRSGQVTPPQNIYDCAVNTVLKASIWNSQLIKASVSTKRISGNFYFGDLRSGHFWDLALGLMRQWENVQMPFFRKYGRERAIYIKIFLY